VVVGGVALTATPASAATFTVTNLNDSGAGSFRQAIIDANTNTGADVIVFSLPEAGPHTIQLTTSENLDQALPPIAEAVTIDGPGSGVPTVEIAEVPGVTNSGRSALWITASGVTVTDLSFRGFGVGIDIRSPATGVTVRRCQFGMDVTGTASSGPEMGVGVQVTSGSGHLVRDNYLANVSTGILLAGSSVTSSVVQANTFGISRDNVTALPIDVGIDVASTGSVNQVVENRIIGNSTTVIGLHVTAANDLGVNSNLIGALVSEGSDFPGRSTGVLLSEGGTYSSFASNYIVGGEGDGIRMSSSGPALSGSFPLNTVRANVGAGIRTTGAGEVRAGFSGSEIYDNVGLGIDTGTPGPNPAGETAGPVITAVDTSVPGNSTVTLSYDGPAALAGASTKVVLATVSACDPSGYGEAETTLSSTTGVVLNASGDLVSEEFDATLGLVPGEIVTAYIDGVNVPLTELSNCFTVPGGPGNTTPVAVTQGSSIPADQPFDVLLEGTDADDDNLTFAIDAAPTHGSLSVVTGIDCSATNACTADITYTPDSGYTGTDSFTFTVDDGTETSDPATVTIDVQAANSRPVAGGASATVEQGGSVQIELQGTDADSDVLTFAVQSESANGGSIGSVAEPACVDDACTLDVTYTAPTSFLGTDSFTYTVNDGTETSDPATVTVDVTAANAAPVARPGSFPVVSDGSAQGRVLYATDVDEDILTFTITQQPANGVVSGPGAVSCAPDETFGGEWTCQQTWGYTATPGYSGPDSFEFKACDPSGECDTETVTVTVTAPVAQTDLALLTLSDLPDPVTAGGVVAYEATVKNLGPDTATGVSVDFSEPAGGALPSGVTFESGTVTSSDGGSGTCSVPGPESPVVCSLGTGTVPASSSTTWTVTVYLRTSSTTPATIDVRARVSGNETDPGPFDNEQTATTAVQPFGGDETTVFVPPSDSTVVVATAPTVLVNGEQVPIALPGDTTAAAVSVPPGGPGGVVTVAELECEPPFCATAARTVVPTPSTPPIDDRIVQFIPPTDQYYDYRRPVTYTISYDASVVAGVRVRTVKVLYTKDDAPETLYQAVKCPKQVTASTEFPCLKAAKILKGKDQRLKGDLVLTVRGTYNDPKIAGFR
jgi:uncharacterized repeat protein (TIGR01451 family)